MIFILQQVNQNTFKQILMDLTNFVEKVKTLPLLTDEIPTGILLAGLENFLSYTFFF